jgi:hypothetical protein
VDNIETYIVGGAYVRVPAGADLATAQALRAAAATRGLPCYMETTAGPNLAYSREVIAQHHQQRGLIVGGVSVQRDNQRAFLDRLEDIARGKVRVT